MLWIEKYRPQKLDELTFNSELTVRLNFISKYENLPHIIFYGSSGAGKKTRIMALLRSIYDEEVIKKKIQERSFKYSSNNSIDITIISSKFHIEIDPSDVGNYDKYIINEIIKEIPDCYFKIIVISNADLLTLNAQKSLRRIMEKYIKKCRFIFCCEDIGRISKQLSSRCSRIRVLLPDNKDVYNVLSDVCVKENINIPGNLIERIVTKSECNVSKALLLLEACYTQSYPFKSTQEIPNYDWESVISNICDIISKKSDCKILIKVRLLLYDLLTNCIPTELILKKFVEELKCIKKTDIILLAAKYDSRIKKGKKDIYHLEAFVVNCMKLI